MNPFIGYCAHVYLLCVLQGSRRNVEVPENILSDAQYGTCRMKIEILVCFSIIFCHNYLHTKDGKKITACPCQKLWFTTNTAYILFHSAN